MGRIMTALVAAIVAVAGAGAAPAALLTRSYAFEASGIRPLFGGTIPYDRIAGSFTVTFDAAVDSVDATSIVLDGLDPAFVDRIVFDYSAANDYLVVGGAEQGADGLLIGSNDFYLGFGGAVSGSRTPSSTFSYTAAGVGNVGQAARVTVSDVPEPATWATTVAGFALLGVALRRRRPRPVAIAG